MCLDCSGTRRKASVAREGERHRSESQAERSHSTLPLVSGSMDFGIHSVIQESFDSKVTRSYLCPNRILLGSCMDSSLKRGGQDVEGRRPLRRGEILVA